MPPATMTAMITSGTGGFDRLEYRDLPVPDVGPGEVLIRVLAAGVNNTDVNTRLGWYSLVGDRGTDGRLIGDRSRRWMARAEHRSR
jgi:threonine dehydrogenase-like Zn-dependent dehydrogenase